MTSQEFLSKNINIKLNESADVNGIDFRQFVDNKAVKKYEPLDNSFKNQSKILSLAKKGDSDAQQYIFYKLAPIIGSSFFENFLGPNKTVRAGRINEGAAVDWAGICWEVLFGKQGKKKMGIEYFNPEKVKSLDSIWGVLGNQMKLLFKTKATDENLKTKIGGMSGVATHSHITDEQKEDIEKASVSTYDPMYNDKGLSHEGDDLGTSGGGSYEDKTFDSVVAEEDMRAFLSKWKQLAQDEEIHKPIGRGGKTTLAELLASILEGSTQNDLVEKFGISKGSMSLYANKLPDLVSKYNIDSNTFYKALRDFGPIKLGSYLVEPIGDFNIETEQPAPEVESGFDQPEKGQKAPKATEEVANKKVNKSQTFIQKFKSAFSDPSGIMWKGIKSTNPANVLYQSIIHPRYNLEKIARKEGIEMSLAKNYMNRAIKELAEYGITKDELLTAVKKYGPEKIGNMIGEAA